MRRTEALWEVFVVRFEERWSATEAALTAEEAGELLGMSAGISAGCAFATRRTGRDGLRDRRLGKVSPRRAPAWELARMQRALSRAL